MNDFFKKGCDTLCPWNEFIKLIDNKTVDNLIAACGKQAQLKNAQKHGFEMSTVELETDSKSEFSF